MVNKNRWKYSFDTGRKTEDVFHSLMIDRGNTCIKSSKEDDIQKHIDFYVNGIGVDVKGNRHLETIWLEIKNVRGDRGWLEGEAEYIVFDVVELSSFCVFYREDLLLFVSTITDIASGKNDYMKLYTRNGRSDVLVKVRYSDIEFLEKYKIKYESNKFKREVPTII